MMSPRSWRQRQDALAVAQKNKAATLALVRPAAEGERPGRGGAQGGCGPRSSDREEAPAKKRRRRARGTKSGGRARRLVGSDTRGGGTFGYFIMPVHGWKSSNFGMRYDPFYHRWQLHAGVDIAAAGGTPIRAAAAGRVVRAGWAGGYGNYTCIDTRPLSRARASRPATGTSRGSWCTSAQHVSRRPGHRPGRRDRRRDRLPPALRGADQRQAGAAAELVTEVFLLMGTIVGCPERKVASSSRPTRRRVTTTRSSRPSRPAWR